MKQGGEDETKPEMGKLIGISRGVILLRQV